MHILHRTPVSDRISAELDFGEPLLAPEDFECDWTDRDLRVSRLSLLECSMRDLEDTRTSLATAKEIIEWVETMGTGPFGFRSCATVAGREYGLDPEVAVEAIADKAHRVMKRRFPYDFTDRQGAGPESHADIGESLREMA